MGLNVRVENLSKRFGDKIVLDNLSLEVTNGQNVVVFGRSGTGKSVLLKCIVKLLKPDIGTVLIDNKNINLLSNKQLNDLRKKIGFLFQSAALYDSMTVKENLRFPLVRNFNYSTAELEAKIITALKQVDLTDALNKMPSELSGGMKKRIGLARAIITEPELILYDEPTTGLDPITSKEISQLIVNLKKNLNATSIIVTHDLICGQTVADRAIVLNEGKIYFEGSINSLLKSNDVFLKKFFSMEINEIQTGT